MSELNQGRMDKEDALHVGATRPVRFLGLPMPLAVALLAVGYFLQTNITGLEGIAWAVAVVAPVWGVSYIAVAHDPYGINVSFAWVQTCVLSLDKGLWGGASCAPLPAAKGN